MSPSNWSHDRPGMALVLVLMVLLAAAAVAGGAAMVGSNAWLIHQYADRQSVLETVADAGLEEARAALNGRPELFPDSGYVVLESQSQVRDVEGRVIPGVTRTTYVGPTGATTGQYGIFGSIVVVADDGRSQVIRRAEITQESFARYAYFTDFEPSNIVFGGGDQLFGPVHSNDNIRIHTTGATFHGSVRTAGTVVDARYGTFRQGYEERVSPIDMPNTADLNRLRDYAQGAGMAFVSNTAGNRSQATMRIEFVEIDGYGFIRVYQANSNNNAFWVTATTPSNYNSQGMRDSPNCGHYHPDGRFYSANQHPVPGHTPQHDWMPSITSGGRCFLGGAEELFNGFQQSDSRGAWLQLPPGRSTHVARNAGRPDSLSLFPISRELNPEFKGVIHVTGKVAISGVVRGQVTLAATGDIVIADDLTYAIDPGDPERNCLTDDDSTYDILGLFAGGDIVIADNTLNSPIRPRSNQGNYVTLDDTPYETIHATLLTLGVFTADNYDQGSTRDQPCESTQWGRGCLYLEGGVIQRERGPVGMSNGTGYLKRYSYDSCVLSNPPPYFPTTGKFDRSRYFEIDPVDFDVDRLFNQLTSG